MKELWQITQKVAKEHSELIVNASLVTLSELIAKEAGLDSVPSPSHVKYILEQLGYSFEGKGFVYKHKENHE